MKIKTTRDGFSWAIVTDKALEMWETGLFELYILHEDDSETLVTSADELKEALELGLEIGEEITQ